MDNLGEIPGGHCLGSYPECLLSFKAHHDLAVVALVAVIVAFTGSPPAGLKIVLPLLSAALVGVAPEAIHRVATISTQTFDTLPFQGAVIVTLGLCGLTHKEGYFPVMMTTVIWTGVAAIVAAILLTLFPGLA